MVQADVSLIEVGAMENYTQNCVQGNLSMTVPGWGIRRGRPVV